MDWVRGATIGRGSFGTVSLAMFLHKPTNPIVGGGGGREAEQEDHRPQLMAVKSSDLIQSASLFHEKQVLTHLAGCPHIVRCLGDDVTGENNRKSYNLFLEYVPGGTLADLRKRRNVIEKPSLRLYTRSVLRGLMYIHRKGYVHCDIKLQNILVGGGSGDDGDIKIADFGLSKKVGEEVDGGAHCLRGTPVYMAPESVAWNEYEPPADIWSLGCAVFEMLTGKLAWGSLGDVDMMVLLYQIAFGEELPQIPVELSDEERDFLSRCFVRDPRARWTAEMLLDHPFISASKTSPEGDAGNVAGVSKEKSSSVLDKFSAAPPVQSPTSIFGFSQWVSRKPEPPPSGESHSSLTHRIRLIATGEQKPKWDYFSDEGWISVRQAEEDTPVCKYETEEPNETTSQGGIREHSCNRLIMDLMMYGMSESETEEPKEASLGGIREHSCNWLILDMMMYGDNSRDINLVVKPGDTAFCANSKDPVQIIVLPAKSNQQGRSRCITDLNQTSPFSVDDLRNAEEKVTYKRWKLNSGLSSDGRGV